MNSIWRSLGLDPSLTLIAIHHLGVDHPSVCVCGGTVWRGGRTALPLWLIPWGRQLRWVVGGHARLWHPGEWRPIPLDDDAVGVAGGFIDGGGLTGEAVEQDDGGFFVACFRLVGERLENLDYACFPLTSGGSHEEDVGG